MLKERDMNKMVKDGDAASKASPTVTKGRTEAEKQGLDKRFQKKTQIEHIILRPDTYIGSTEPITTSMWVMDPGHDAFIQREVSYVPGLYKIFDEILVNAADNKQRDENMKTIKVNIDAATGSISVFNDGKGIPVHVHSEHNVPIPELIFGHLLTGDNFSDDEQRTTGGRNGYGAKLTNIFSLKFIIETVDATLGQRYEQIWEKNMQVCHPPKITKDSGKSGGHTKVTFFPDYARFNMPEGMSADTLALFRKRVYDLSGTVKGVKVYLNDELIKINSFEKYVDLYLKPSDVSTAALLNASSESANELEGGGGSASATAGPVNVLPKLYERINERWEICVSISPDAQADQVSFVNSICTSKGGQHVHFVADQLANHLIEVVKKKNKTGAVVKPAQIKSHLFVFVNALIENPAFDSQTKENLTTKSAKFGPKEFLPKLSDKLLTKVSKCGIVENILNWANAKSQRELKKKGGGKKSKITGIAKLNDANLAGSSKSAQTTLILTEGDSAMSLALTGISVVGRDYYGVFPLKGKLLNVRDATHAQIMKNEEIQNLMKIIGLQPTKVYNDVKDLRYGHVMIMTDQDSDGSHIKGLLMNFFHHFWPSLLRIDGFLKVFITPIVKATNKNEVLSFFSIQEYEDFKKSLTPAQLAKWQIKYYKGLGTNTAKEAESYFRDLDRHEIVMVHEGEVADDAIEMAFAKKRVNDRKTWLSTYSIEGSRVDFDVDEMNYGDFVNKELIQFSVADNARSIPAVIDGLKTSQRKVLFAALKRNLRQEMKVAQFAGYTGEHAAYHHGEASLMSTIIGMAQNFCGSNNINLLFPSGAFGTRRLGGKDAASPRYIFTRLTELARLLFHPDDDVLLRGQVEDGQSIEPVCYVPVIPFILVNGASGIGTGWSTDIPCYNPLDIIRAMRQKILGCEHEPLTPWYRGFTGGIEPEISSKKGVTGRYIITGKFHLDDARESIFITELPIGTWTNNYKEFLEELMLNAPKDKEDTPPGEKPSAKAAKNATTAANANDAGGDETKATSSKKLGKAKPKKSKKKKNADGEEDEDDVGDDDDDEEFNDHISKDSDDDADEDDGKGNKGKKREESFSLAGNIKDIRENHSDVSVNFEVVLTPEIYAKFKELSHNAAMKKLRLISSISTTNMIAFDFDGKLRRYDSVNDILADFATIRLDYYAKRKAMIEARLVKEHTILANKARFVELVCDGTVQINNKKRKVIIQQLVSLKFDMDDSYQTTGDGEDPDPDALDPTSRGYEYLLKMPIYSLTEEKIKALKGQAAEKEHQLRMIRLKTPAELWITDLDNLEAAIIQEQQATDDNGNVVVKIHGKKASSKKKKGAVTKKKAIKMEVSDDDDDDVMIDDDDSDFESKKPKPKQVQKKPIAASAAPLKALSAVVAVPPKIIPATKVIVAASDPVTVAPPKVTEIDVSDEDIFSKIEQAKTNEPTSTKPVATKKPTGGAKKASSKKRKNSDDEEEFDDDVVAKKKPAATTTTTTTTTTTLKKTKTAKDEEHDDVTTIKEPAVTRQPRRAAAQARKVLVESDPDEDDESEFSDAS